MQGGPSKNCKVRLGIKFNCLKTLLNSPTCGYDTCSSHESKWFM